MASRVSEKGWSLAKEAYPFLLVLASLTLAAIFVHYLLALFFGVLLLMTAAFFRDPNREIHRSLNAVLSPADGHITGIDALEKAPYLLQACTRISIFLSILDVHVNRAPIEGRVQFIRYQPGQFHAAFLKEAASSNECNWIGIEGPKFTLLMRQIAGAIARRIVCYSEVGDRLEQGQRIGIIRFGSGAEVYVPKGFNINVTIGQKVEAGRTVLATLP